MSDNPSAIIAKIIAESPTLRGSKNVVTHFEKHGHEFNAGSIEAYEAMIASVLDDPETELAFSTTPSGRSQWIFCGKAPCRDHSGASDPDVYMFISLAQNRVGGNIFGTAYRVDGPDYLKGKAGNPDYPVGKYAKLSGQKTEILTGGISRLADDNFSRAKNLLDIEVLKKSIGSMGRFVHFAAPQTSAKPDAASDPQPEPSQPATGSPTQTPKPS